jgi:AcrR family transcriptional regulator
LSVTTYSTSSAVVSVPIGTACVLPYHEVRLAVKRTKRKSIARGIGEVYGVEGLDPYVVEKSGSRRSSVERREEILNVAFFVLAERGYRGASMLEIARRAQASKETLYAWFGDKRGLFEELVRWQAERVDAAIAPNLDHGSDDPSEVLRGFVLELQRLLLGERSVVINRAAISEATSDPTFARILAAQGRGSVVPKLVRYLEGQRERGRLEFEEAGAAIDTIIGLAIGDQQVRRLLGVLPIPDPEQMEARAERTVRSFLRLFGREDDTIDDTGASMDGLKGHS